MKQARWGTVWVSWMLGLGCLSSQAQFSAGAVYGSDPAAEPMIAQSPVMEWLSNYLEVGTRLTLFTLSETTRPYDPPELKQTFVGHINDLDEEQNYWPVKVFVTCYFTPYVAAELTYDQVAAHTRNNTIEATDGSVEMAGPIVSLIFRYPVQDTFIPYVGIGYAFMNASFDEAAYWAQAWPSPAAFAEAGGEGFSPFGYRRVMEVEDDNAVVLTAGTSFFFTDHVALDLMVRYMDITADAVAVRYVHDIRETEVPGSFPLEHIAYGVGVRCAF